jgi:enamine deaminase RidA (YjgF/YER057c/UK114 family)
VTSTAAEPLLPVTLGAGRIPFARGMRAGPWVFASGVLATDFENGIAPDVLCEGRPLSGDPRWYREASRMYALADEVLRAGGADFSRVVRTDQYFPDWRAVPFLHQARREYCGNYVAPSTSVLLPRLPLPQAGMTMDVIAVRDGDIEPVFPSGLEVPSTSAFVPVVIARDLVFVAGFLAAHQPGDLGGIAPEAKVPEGHLWKGNRIQLEVDYIIRRKLIPALEGAGAALGDVVKAQIYLADLADVPAAAQVWGRHFGDSIPATTFVQTMNPGFAIADARCEINVIALRGGSRLTRKAIAGALPPVCERFPSAVRAGDLVFFSGLIAADAEGLVRAARIDPRQPYYGSSIEAQMECLIDEAARVCEAAGTSLENLVRIQQFHTDLSDFYPACRVWQRRLPGRALPIAAAQVPGPLAVPGCTVQLDLWAYVG